MLPRSDARLTPPAAGTPRYIDTAPNVLVILPRRSEDQMLRVHAARLLAQVADDEVRVWFETPVASPREAVRRVCRVTRRLELPVTGWLTSPEPEPTDSRIGARFDP